MLDEVVPTLGERTEPLVLEVAVVAPRGAHTPNNTLPPRRAPATAELPPALQALREIASRLTLAPRRWLRYVNLAIITLFLVHVIWLGLWLSWTSRVRSFQGIPEISYSWVTMSLPVGAGLLLEGVDAVVMHPIEVLDESYRRAGKEAAE